MVSFVAHSVKKDERGATTEQRFFTAGKIERLFEDNVLPGPGGYSIWLGGLLLQKRDSRSRAFFVKPPGKRQRRNCMSAA